MFTKLLHYDFGAQAAAIDVSGRDVHGVSTGLDFSPGAHPSGLGAAVFAQQDSRIRTVSREPFRHLTATKIQIEAILEPTGARQNLVEGFLSFAFYVAPNGSLVGTAKESNAAGGGWRGVDSYTDSPDGLQHSVPFGQWATLTYYHDGSTNLALLVDGHPVAYTDSAPAPLQTVGWRGVHIGNWPDSDRFALSGSVREIQISRWDPSAVTRQFASRLPGPCWGEVGRALRSMGEERERMARLYRCIIQNQQTIVSLLRRRPGGPQLIRDFSKRYRTIWASGGISGDEMFQLLSELFGELNEDERALFNRALQNMQDCLSSVEFDSGRLEAVDMATCDPEFTGYIVRLAELLEG